MTAPQLLAGRVNILSTTINNLVALMTDHLYSLSSRYQCDKAHNGVIRNPLPALRNPLPASGRSQRSSE